MNHLLKTTCLAIVGLLLRNISQGAPSDGPEKLPLPLKRGSFIALHYPADLTGLQKIPKSLIIFGSGCGGWSYWEDRVCRKLQADGNDVIGVDFYTYALSDYDLPTLQGDYQKIIITGLSPYSTKPPVILGGWSTGAEQSVAVASGVNAPKGLAGLLLVSPGSEGGFGTFATNYLFLNAPTSKVFPLANLAPALKNLRIAQWHAELDPLDSRAWLSFLKTTHNEFDFPYAVHDYQGACPEFLKELEASVTWILTKPAPVLATAPKR